MNEYISGLAKDTARDFYYAALFAAPKHQNALFTLAAFHGEMTGIRGKIKNELAGQVRLQWWHDALENNAIEALNNPLFKAFSEIITQYKLPKHLLLNKINAHVFDLYDDPFPDLNTLEGHYGETFSSLFMLNSIVLGDDSQSELAGYAGVAYGLWVNPKTNLAKPIDYYEKAITLYKVTQSPAFLPLLLTKYPSDIGNLRKLWLMWRGSPNPRL